MIIFNLYLTIKIYQRLYGGNISILYKMRENIVKILHVYVSRAINILFYDDKDTESE